MKKNVMHIRTHYGHVDFYKMRNNGWWISTVWVKRNMRGRGYALDLLNELKQRARAQKIKMLWLFASPAAYGTPFDVLKTLYKSAGFTPIGTSGKMVCRL